MVKKSGGVSKKRTLTPGPFDFMVKNKVHVLLILIILLNVLLRMYFFVGLNLSDTPVYMNRLVNLLDGFQPKKQLAGVYGSRILMYFPPMFAIKIFGLSEMAVVSQSMLCSILLIPLVYRISRIFYDEWTSLLSSLIVGVVPFNILWASWYMPDVPLEFYTSLAAYFLFLGVRDRGNRHFLFLLSGLATGLAFLVKVTAMIFVVFASSMVLYYILKERRIGYAPASFALGFCMMVLLQVAVFSYYNVGTIRNLAANILFYDETANWNDLLVYPSILFGINKKTLEFELTHFTSKFGFVDAPLFGFFGFYMLLSLIYLLYKRSSKDTMILLWFIVLAIYLNFGTQSITEWKMIHKDGRFISILLPAASIMVSRMIVEFLRKSTFHRITAVILLLSLVSSSLYVTHALWVFDNSRIIGYRLAYDFLKGKSGFYYADFDVYNFMRIYHGSDLDLDFIRIELIDCQESFNAYVVYEDLSSLQRYKSKKSCLVRIPSKWVMEFDSLDHVPDNLKKIKRSGVQVWRIP
ncbi:MAG: glycosyltransferase family 39 protein [Candidatus Altiarchaeota archaeon]